MRFKKEKPGAEELTGMARLKKTVFMKDLADALGVAEVTMKMWDEIPEKHLDRVVELTGLPASVIRPDLQPAKKSRTTIKG